MRSNHPVVEGDDDGPLGGGDSLDGGQGGSAVLIRIHVPDLNIHKCLQFYRHDLVWDVKQQCLASLPKELKESFNYGLFAPPCNGKAGKFLDEERPLSDYPFSGPVGYLELRYKRRLYKGLNLEEKQLKQIHTKSNLRRFLDYVSSAHCDKITKMCAKGLDPNFHCPETGETPLTMAALMKKPTKLLMALVNGGALLDYRTKEGCTGMHRAVEAKSYEAVKTMLDLGGSPNYKDAKGLTPLYLSVSLQADPTMTQLLLHDHAFIGAQDLQGWHEVHQACRTGLVQHLEHLLYYGADMNARNASGNTPLHVCAVNNQESSARLLLFRGADKDALNFANQTPYQMAVIAGNMELAEIIQTHRSQDVVPYRDLPSYNPRRRCLISRAFSDPRLNMSLTSLSTRSLSRVFAPHHHRPPSPCPSLRSLPHFSPSSSSCPSSCSSTHGGGAGRHTRSGSCSDSSYSSISHSAASDFSEISEHCGSATTEKSLDHSDITSDSSGVGTCNSGGSASSYEPATPTDATLILPGTMVVCVENFAPQSNLHLKLAEGDIIEVIGSAEGGTVLEGSLRGRIGLFPAQCVQEIRMKSYEKHHNNHLAPPSANHTQSSGKKGAKGGAPPAAASTPNAQHLSRIKKVSQVNLGGPAVCDQASSFVCRWGEPHTVILHRGQKGFGFILRGAKADSPLMELTPSERFPALQYLDDVDEGGVADRAGLRKGDFILAINGMDVSQLSHEVVVDMIRKSGELVSLTVVGLSRLSAAQGEEDGTKLKPGSPAASLTHDGAADGGSHKVAQNHFATLPRKHSAGSTGPTTVPSPPRRDPTTSLSVGRARAKSMVAALADLDSAGLPISPENGGVISTSADSVSGKPPLPPGATTGNGTLLSNGGGAQTKTASIRARPTSSRITAAEMQEIFADSTPGGNKCGTWNGPPHKIYASVAEMKRSKSALKGKEAVSTLHKDFHSTPDLKGLVQKKPGDKDQVKSLSQENLNKLVLRSSNSNPRHSWTLDRNFFPSSNLNYNDKLPEPPTESELAASRTESGAGGAETDGSTSDDDGQSSTESENGGGEETNKVVNNSSNTKGKTPVLTDGEYRTTKLIRPVQSKTLPRRASTGCTISPAEQQTIINLVPPGQVIKVDVSKNKQDIYGTLEHGHSGPGQNSGGGGGPGSGGTLSKGQSGPGVMSSFKPTDSAKLYASPDDLRPIGYRDSSDATSPNGNNGGGTLKKIRSQSLPPSKDASTNKKVDYAEPHNRNNNVCNGDDGGGNVNSFKRTAAGGANQTNGQGGFDPQRSLQEAKEKLRPVKPVLKSSSSLQNSQTPDKIRIEVKQSPRLGRKSEKTVTFQTHPDAADLTPPDSPMAHSMSVDDIAKVKTSLKISKSFPNDLGGEEGSGGGGGEGGENYVTNLPVNQPDSDSVSEDSSDKTWILKDENGGPSSTSTTSDSVQTVISAASKVLKTTTTEEKISNLSAQEQNKKPLSASAQLGITHNFEQMQQQHQQLYGRLGDSSSNYGTITRGTGTGGGGGGVARQPPNLTKNAVSLVKLPPPMEIESESESGRETPVGKKTVTVMAGPNQMYHTLQPQRSRSMLSQAGGGGGTEQPQQLQHQYHLQQQQIAARQLQQLQMQGQMQGTRQAEKSIEESLKLIQMHVAALKQDFPSVVPPPPEFGLRNQTPILAPPPEFSDARDTHEAATRFNQGHMFTAEQQQQHQLQQQNQFNRQSPMYRSISHAHSSTSSMYSGYPTMTRQQYQQQQQLHQLQQQHAAAAAQHHQHLMQSQQQAQQQQQQQQATYGTLQARSAQATYGTTSGTGGGQGGAYGHYQTLTPKSNTGPISSSGTPPVPQTAPPSYGHHPKCYYYQQTPSATTPTTNSNSAKLHPVHRYTPDLYESSSGPRIVGTIPKKQAGSDHYEVPHAHQVMLQQQQQQQQQAAAAAAAASAQMQLQAQQQQQQQSQQQQQQQTGASSRVRREFRNKTLVEWTVCDSCDWLDSLFMQEYKGIFSQRGIDGKKLLRMDNATLLDLGVKKLGHRMNIEKSLKRYLPQAKS